MSDELSQAEHAAREDAAKAAGFGEPKMRRAWQAGRDYGREHERVQEEALSDLVEWCAGPLGLEGDGAADSNSHDEPINCLLSSGTLRVGMAALGKGRAALALSERSDTEPGEPEGQPDEISVGIEITGGASQCLKSH